MIGTRPPWLGLNEKAPSSREDRAIQKTSVVTLSCYFIVPAKRAGLWEGGYSPEVGLERKKAFDPEERICDFTSEN
jgi:hypothetical protein